MLIGVFVLPFAAFAASPVVTTNPASGIGETQATLYGSVTSTKGPLSVWAELGKSASDLYFSTAPSNYGSRTAVAYSKKIIKLEPNTTYYFRIVAQNPDGKTVGSLLSFRTKSSGGGTSSGSSDSTSSGSAPTGGMDNQSPGVTTMFAINIMHNSLTFNGYVLPQGSNTYRWFEWGTTQMLGNRSGYEFAGTQPNNFSFTITGLNAGTTYYVRAVAQNNAGIVQGSIFGATTLALNQSPVGTSSFMIAPLVSAKPPIGIAPTQATLNAIAIPGSAPLVAGYFEWGLSAQTLTNGTPPQQLQSSGVASFTNALSNFTPGTTYYYRAAVQDANLLTYRSNVVSFNTVSRSQTPPAPTSTEPKTPTQNDAIKKDSSPKTENADKNIKNQNGSGAAGAIFFGNPSVGLIGWLLAIVFLIISVALGVILLRNKKRPKNANGTSEFREFPE